MCAVKCTFFSPQMIGWREDALKMVFLITDQNYHTAGDGKVLDEMQNFIGSQWYSYSVQ